MCAFDLSPEALSEYKQLIIGVGIQNWHRYGDFYVAAGDPFNISGPAITASSAKAAEYIALMCPAHVREMVEEIEYLREANNVLRHELEQKGVQNE